MVEDALLVCPGLFGDGVIVAEGFVVGSHLDVGDGVDLAVQVDESLVDLLIACQVEGDVEVFLVPV